MKSLSGLLAYTQNKKKEQLEELEESHCIRPKEIFNQFLRDSLKIKSTVSLNMQRLSNWYLWQFLDSYFDTGQADYQLLAKSTYYGYQSNLLNSLIGQLASGYDSAVSFDVAVMHLSQMLFLGWDELADKYGKHLLNMLEDKFYKGDISKPLYPWFIMELFCKWQQISLSHYNVCRSDDLGIYEKALAHLLSTDELVINAVIEELIDFHIKNSDEYVKTDSYGNELGAEFSSSDYFIFPAEILMFLSVRRRLSLPEYKYTSELFLFKINYLPQEMIEYPKDEVVEKIFEKIYKENPCLQTGYIDFVSQKESISWYTSVKQWFSERKS